jgi:hypothetical protein
LMQIRIRKQDFWCRSESENMIFDAVLKPGKRTFDADLNPENRTFDVDPDLAEIIRARPDSDQHKAGKKQVLSNLLV